MTRNTEQRYDIPKVTLTPFDDLDADELRDAGYKAHFAVANLQTSAMLLGRNMIGVAVRHETRMSSLNAVERTQENMARGKLSAFVIRSNGGWVGLGSIMPDLALRRPGNVVAPYLPARITRGTHFGELVATTGPNVSAWIDASEPEVTYKIVLSAAYELLRKEAGGDGWTIEPTDSILSGEAIASSGMPLLAGPDRFDDLEVRGYSRVPLSNLYQSVT
jgi:hypothetical protein